MWCLKHFLWSGLLREEGLWTWFPSTPLLRWQLSTQNNFKGQEDRPKWGSWSRLSSPWGTPSLSCTHSLPLHFSLQELSFAQQTKEEGGHHLRRVCMRSIHSSGLGCTHFCMCVSFLWAADGYTLNHETSSLSHPMNKYSGWMGMRM